MSNLTLENTGMHVILNTKKFQYRWGKLGHNTYAFATGSTVKIQYHGNTIADLRLVPNQGVVIQVTDAGWPTVTTRARINQILKDNEVPAYACQRKNEQKLYWRNNETSDNLWSEYGYGYPTFHSAHFARKYFTETWEVIPR